MAAILFSFTDYSGLLIIKPAIGSIA